MTKINAELARDTIVFHDKGDSVVGIWDAGSVFEKYSLYISFVEKDYIAEKDEIRIGVTGTGESYIGNHMESLLTASFSKIAEHVNNEQVGSNIMSLINESMKKMKGE